MQIQNGIAANAQMVASHVTHGQQIHARDRVSDVANDRTTALDRVGGAFHDGFEHGTLVESVPRQRGRRESFDWRGWDEDQEWSRRFNELRHGDPDELVTRSQRPDPWRALSVDRTRETQDRAASTPGLGELPPNFDQLMNRAQATLLTFEPDPAGSLIDTRS